MSQNSDDTDNVINLPLSGLWFVLDDQLRPRPLPNRSDLGFPAMEDMEQAFEYRWGYQSKVGETIISSTFLALNHVSLFAGDHQLRVFELAILGEESTEIVGRFADIDECIEAQHHQVAEMSRFMRAANE